MFVSKVFTFFIVLDLVVAFVGINAIVDSLDIDYIDITANQLYTLSNESKEVLKNVDQDVKVYVYGIEGEKNSLIDLLKQYNETNEKITYEILTEENNLEKVKEFELESGTIAVIVESGESKKTLNTSDFYEYDSSTGESADLTEEVLTNAVLAMVAGNQPKVYFVTGHGEYGDEEISSLKSYLKYESMEYDSVNLSTAGSVPEDCTTLAIIAPAQDFLESEVQSVIDYINKGGNLFVAQDVVYKDTQFTNLQKILDLYGVSMPNSLIKENSSTEALSSYPNIFRPQISDSNPITADISSDNYGMIMAYCRRLEFLSDEELEELNVTREDLLTTTEEAQCTNEISKNMKYGEEGQLVISSLLTKKIETPEAENNDEEKVDDETVADEESESDEESEEDSVESKLIIVGNAVFLSDYSVSQVTDQYSMFVLASNKDFALNSLENLGEKEAQLTIRKNITTSSYTYTATTTQRIIVIIAILLFPILIIIAGIIVGIHRKKRK